jgi:hypothetical protein
MFLQGGMIILGLEKVEEELLFAETRETRFFRELFILLGTIF